MFPIPPRPLFDLSALVAAALGAALIARLTAPPVVVIRVRGASQPSNDSRSTP